jgi:hypothetical protein
MSLKYLALLGSVAADQKISITEQNLTGNGGQKDLYVTDCPWAQPVASSTGFTLPHDGRVYLAEKNKCGKHTPDMYYSPNLLGGSIEYDFDLSTASCGCNVGIYLISMPGYDASGNPLPSSGGDFYCDANQVGGVWCPELDIMEANLYAWHFTPHTCDSQNGKNYPKCDRGGCGKSIHSVDSTAYGPGS